MKRVFDELIKAGLRLTPPIDIDCSSITPELLDELLDEGSTQIVCEGKQYKIRRDWFVSRNDLSQDHFKIKLVHPK